MQFWRILFFWDPFWHEPTIFTHISSILLFWSIEWFIITNLHHICMQLIHNGPCPTFLGSPYACSSSCMKVQHTYTVCWNVNNKQVKVTCASLCCCHSLPPSQTNVNLLLCHLSANSSLVTQSTNKMGGHFQGIITDSTMNKFQSFTANITLMPDSTYNILLALVLMWRSNLKKNQQYTLGCLHLVKKNQNMYCYFNFE